MESVLHSGTAKLAPGFFAHAARTPKKQAIWCEGQTINYQALAQLVCRWSNAMASNGVKRGDHIGVLLPNSIEFVALMLVAADLGAVLVPLNTSLTTSAIQRAFEVADVKHVVATANLLDALLKPELAADFSPLWLQVDGLWLSIDE